MVFCPSCGNRAFENVKFCMKCDYNIEKYTILEILNEEERPPEEPPNYSYKPLKEYIGLIEDHHEDIIYTQLEAIRPISIRGWTL